MNITRRRTLQGVGAVGVAGLAGPTVVSADSGDDSAVRQVQQQGDAALRVVHASPDTPSVEIRLDEAVGAGGADGTATPGQDGTPTGGQDDPLIDGLGFRDVSDYNVVDPGTYRLQIVATEESGLLDEIFGDGDDQERVIHDEDVEIEAGATYTAVAYGELARADPGETGTDAGVGEETPAGGVTPGADQETPAGGRTTPVGEQTPTEGGPAGDGDALVDGLAFGEHQYVEIDAGDQTLVFRESQAAGDDSPGAETTPAGGGTTPGDDGTTLGDQEADGQDDRAFQVEVLEDELTVAGTGTTGVDEGTPGTGDGAPTGTETPEEPETSRLRIFHAIPDVDAVTVTVADPDDGDGGILDGGDDGRATETSTDGTGTAGEDRTRRANISPEGGTVYSGFALGYFDPPASAGGTPTEGGGATTDGGTETPAGGEDDELTEEPEGAEFEFVTVEDAQGGERSDGGTGGGLLPSMEPAQAPSD